MQTQVSKNKNLILQLKELNERLKKDEMASPIEQIQKVELMTCANSIIELLENENELFENYGE